MKPSFGFSFKFKKKKKIIFNVELDYIFLNKKTEVTISKRLNLMFCMLNQNNAFEQSKKYFNFGNNT